MAKCAKILLSMVFLSILSGAAQITENPERPLDETMLKYKEACLTERRAVREKSQLTMMKAHKLFQGIKTGTFKYEIVSATPAESLGKPVMKFTPEYCEYLIKNQYSIVPLDSLKSMRDVSTSNELLANDFSLQPNSSAIISIRARGNCAMLVISEDGAPLSVSSTVDGEPLVFNVEDDGTVSWKTWTLPRTFRNMDFKIENPNDRQVSFTVAVQ